MEDNLIDNYDHVNPHIFYVPSSIPGKGCDLNAFESQITTSCECVTACHDVTCACVKQNGLNYVDNLLLDDKLSPNGSIMECNSRCGCPTQCFNRVVQFGPNTHLQIIPAGDKGYGLICKLPLQKGQFVCEYAGEVISSEEAAVRRKSDNINYIFALNEFAHQATIQTIVDATYIANIGRYINHSCDPNCIIVPVRVDSVVPKLAIFARRHISAAEEITYNYNGLGNTDAVDGDAGGRKSCLCGAANCAKYLPYNP